MNQFRDILSKRNKKCTKKGKKGYNIFLQGFLLRCTDAKKKGNILEKKFLTDARTSQNIFAFSLLSEHSKQYFFYFACRSLGRRVRHEFKFLLWHAPQKLQYEIKINIEIHFTLLIFMLTIMAYRSYELKGLKMAVILEHFDKR